MCLDANLKVHGKGKNFAPKVAKVPLLVWKSLEGVDCDSRYGYSPYQSHKWFFGQLVTAELEYKALARVTSVSKGLHAHVFSEEQRLNPNMVKRYVARGHKMWPLYGTLFPAVIPAGTKFVIGLDGDIVAEAMTVYNCIGAMNKALGIRELAPGVTHETFQGW